MKKEERRERERERERKSESERERDKERRTTNLERRAEKETVVNTSIPTTMDINTEMLRVP